MGFTLGMVKKNVMRERGGLAACFTRVLEI
jgi:hypothetical protein